MNWMLFLHKAPRLVLDDLEKIEAARRLYCPDSDNLWQLKNQASLFFTEKNLFLTIF